MVLALSLTYFFAPGSLSFAQESSEEPTPAACNRTLSKAARLLITSGILAGLIVQWPRAYYMIAGWKIGAEHTNGGLLLDIPDIENLLSKEELALLYPPPGEKRDDRKIIEMFAHKLSGDYDTEYLKNGDTHFPAPRRISSYFQNFKLNGSNQKKNSD